MSLYTTWWKYPSKSAHSKLREVESSEEQTLREDLRKEDRQYLLAPVFFPFPNDRVTFLLPQVLCLHPLPSHTPVWWLREEPWPLWCHVSLNLLASCPWNYSRRSAWLPPTPWSPEGKGKDDNVSLMRDSDLVTAARSRGKGVQHPLSLQWKGWMEESGALWAQEGVEPWNII